MVIKKTEIFKTQENSGLQKKNKTPVLTRKDKRIVILLSTFNEAGLISVDRRVRGSGLVRNTKT